MRKRARRSGRSLLDADGRGSRGGRGMHALQNEIVLVLNQTLERVELTDCTQPLCCAESRAVLIRWWDTFCSLSSPRNLAS
jgi:hypothetical protein